MLSIETRSVTHPGNGATTVFPYNFLIEDYDVLYVALYDETTELETPLTPAQFVATGLGDENGGTIIYNPTLGPLPSGQRITIERLVPYTQEINLLNQDGFHPEVVDSGFDQIVKQTQQLADILRRTPKFGRFTANRDTVIDELIPNKYLQTNATGTRIVMGDRGNEALMVPGTDTVGNDQVQDQSITQIKLHPGEAGYRYETKAQAEAAGPMATYPEVIELLGRDEPGDFGAGKYRATANEPILEPKLQIGTQWYTWYETWVTPEACGYNAAFLANDDAGMIAALQACLDFAGLTRIPVIITKVFTVPNLYTLVYRENVKIYGWGAETGFSHTGGIDVFDLEPALEDLQAIQGCAFKNFSIVGVAPYTAGSTAFRLKQTVECIMENIRVTGFQNGIKVDGTVSFPTEQTLLSNCRVDQCQTGIWIGDDTGGILALETTLVNCASFDCTNALIVSGAGMTRVYGGSLSYLEYGCVVSDGSQFVVLNGVLFQQWAGGTWQADIAVSLSPVDVFIENIRWSSPVAPPPALGNLYTDGIGNAWVNGKTITEYAFTVSTPVPAGGLLQLNVAQSSLGALSGISDGGIIAECSFTRNNTGSPMSAGYTGNDGTNAYFWIFNGDVGSVDLNGTELVFRAGWILH